MLEAFTGYRVILLDLETTGLSPEADEIIEIAAIIIDVHPDGASSPADFNHLVKLPEGKLLPEEITELTGITENMLERNGITQQEAADKFAEMVCSSRYNVLVVSHNIHFDLSFLNNLLRENGYGSLEDLGNRVDVLDTLTILKDRKSYPHTLADAIAHYKLDEIVRNSHRAMDDTKALFAVLEAMITERDDVRNYINIVGYNPKYGVEGVSVSDRAQYFPQDFDSPIKLYHKNIHPYGSVADCKTTDCILSPLEMAVMIASGENVMKERHRAWRKMMAECPDMPIPESSHFKARDSLHDYLRELILLEEGVLEDFLTPGENYIYQYTACWSGINGKSVDGIDVFSTYPQAWTAFCRRWDWDRDEITYAAFSKSRISIRDRISVTVNSKNEILRVFYHFSNNPSYNTMGDLADISIGG